MIIDIFNNPSRSSLRSYTPFSSTQNPNRFTSSLFTPRLFKPSSSSTYSHRPFCFRCGGRGHDAMSCKIPVRCFLCGAFGHKRYKCSKFRKPPPKSSNPSSGCGDDSCFPHLSQALDAGVTMDCMLLDPDVVGCSSPYCKRIVQNGCVFPSLSKEGPVLEESLVLDGTPESQSSGQVFLDLSPIRFEDFADFEIIDEFEHYYSEELEHASIHPASIAVNSPDCAVGLHDEDKAIYYYVEPLKFLIYCCIQSVYGFACAARACERGSDKLSPFKPAPVKKKSVINKRVHGLVSPANVRRSPRLKKGIRSHIAEL